MWTEKDVFALCRSELFLLDMDGTVYEETSHFERYADELAGTVPDSNRAQFLEDTASVFQGSHLLSYGTSYDAEQDVIRLRDGTTVQWGGGPAKAADSQSVVHVDDPWWALRAVAAHHGATADGLETAFLETRKWMETAEYAMQPMPGLRGAVDALRAKNRKVVLATNSPGKNSEVILRRLGLLDAFDDLVFAAQKPARLGEHLAKWQHVYGIPYSRMVSVGDHARNDILPAADLGLATVYVDRYIRAPREDVTVQLAQPAELGPYLAAVAEQIQP